MKLKIIHGLALLDDQDSPFAAVRKGPETIPAPA